MRPVPKPSLRRSGVTALAVIVLAVGLQAFPAPTRAEPLRWTLERVEPFGISISGSFVFDPVTATVSEVEILTGVSVNPEDGQDDYGVLRYGARYTAVTNVGLLDDNGTLSFLTLRGAPVAAPELASFYYLELFDPAIVADCNVGICDFNEMGARVARIDATFAGEVACAEGFIISASLGGSCGGLPFEVAPIVSYRFNVGGGAHRVVASPVPVPAAAWLFASALGGLAWLRRP